MDEDRAASFNAFSRRFFFSSPSFSFSFFFFPLFLLLAFLFGASHQLDCFFWLCENLFLHIKCRLCMSMYVYVCMYVYGLVRAFILYGKRTLFIPNVLEFVFIVS